VFAEIGQRRSAEQACPHEVGGRSGDDDLATMPRVTDAARAMDLLAHVVIATGERFAGVEPDPNADAPAVEPRVLLDRPLTLDRGGHRVGRLREHHEEGVTLRVNLTARVLRERQPEDSPVLLEELSPTGVAENFRQPGRALDVGEEEGECLRSVLTGGTYSSKTGRSRLAPSPEISEHVIGPATGKRRSASPGASRPLLPRCARRASEPLIAAHLAHRPTAAIADAFRITQPLQASNLLQSGRWIFSADNSIHKKIARNPRRIKISRRSAWNFREELPSPSGSGRRAETMDGRRKELR
jgi:hypothetical protein